MQSEVNKRRAMRQRKARLRRLKITFIFFLIIALLTLLIMCFTVFFQIKRISVSGSKIYNKSQLIKASGLTTDDNLFVVSEEKIEDKMRRKLPFVDSVSLKRVLPDAVILTVTDAKEQSFFESNGKYYVVSENNYILKETTDVPENVYKIVATKIEGNVGEGIRYENSKEYEIIKTLEKLLKDKKIDIDKIDVTNLAQLTVEVEGRFTVILGNTEYSSEKIAHLSSMIESIGERSGTINLSMWTPKNSQGSFVENKS